MYVKTSVRKTKNGEVRYLQLAHNEWDAAKGRSVPRVIYGLGREDELDKDAVRRLVASLSRLLEPGEGTAVPGEGLEFAESRPYGGAYVLDRLWQRLGIATILAGLASSGRGRPRDAAAAERALFGLVANRALAPSSKLAAAEWMSRDVHIDGLGEVSDDACYRAMDWLHDVRGELEKQVYFQVADLLKLLARVAENRTGQAWPAMRRELQRISLGTFTGPAGTFRQRTDIPKTARDLLTALDIDVPRKIHELTTPAA